MQWIYCVAILIGRNIGLVRPFVYISDLYGS